VLSGFGRSRAYATAVHPATTTSNDKKRVALIGARGYTGQALVSLLDTHPYLELSHVSSRQLAGQQLDGYFRSNIAYSNLSHLDVERMEKGREVDAWIMALPNGACKPFVDAIDRANGKGVVVDLSAEHRCKGGECVYGLPGET